MSANINPNVLKNFIVKNLGLNHLTEKQAQNKLGLDANRFEEVNVDENNYVELDEIIQDDALFQKFATMYVEQKENKADVKDQEKDKEEQAKIKDKNGAGV